MAKSKIILADDHSLVRGGLKELIHKDPDLTVVAEAEDGQKLLDLLRLTKCDLVVADISMPNMDGLTAVKSIRQKHPKIKILILSMLKDYLHFQTVMSNGASGYMVKDDASEQLVAAIKTILRGEKYISPSVSTMLVDREMRSAEEGDAPSLEILTVREREVLVCIAKGLSNKNIASELGLSTRTVEHHRSNLTDKLGIKSTASLVKYALSKGLA